MSSDPMERVKLDSKVSLIKVQNQDYDRLLADLARYREAVEVAVLENRRLKQLREQTKGEAS